MSNLVKTRADAIALLNSLEQQMSGMLANSASATSIEFPSDLNPVIDALLAGDCKQGTKIHIPLK